MKSIKAHQYFYSINLIIYFYRKGVLSLSIHPSGKVALSIGKDGKLKMWDLMKSICIYEEKLRNSIFKNCFMFGKI
jgi:WD40 repeat protein